MSSRFVGWTPVGRPGVVLQVRWRPTRVGHRSGLGLDTSLDTGLDRVWKARKARPGWGGPSSFLRPGAPPVAHLCEQLGPGGPAGRAAVLAHHFGEFGDGGGARGVTAGDPQTGAHPGAVEAAGRAGRVDGE